MKTEVDVIDRGVSKLVAGETTAHLATIGDGKTTLAVQLASSTALRASAKGRRQITYFFNFECDRDAKRKLQSAATGCPRTLDPPYDVSKGRVASNRVLQQLNQSLAFFDGNTGNADLVAFVRSSIMRHQTQRNEPGTELVVVDGISEIADRLGAPSYRYRHLENVVEALRDLARELRCPVWFTHQLPSKENSRDPLSLPNPHYASGWKGLWSSGLVRTGLVTGRLSDGCAVFVPMKGTRPQPPYFARLSADCARWTLDGVSHLRVVGSKIHGRQSDFHTHSQLDAAAVAERGFVR